MKNQEPHCGELKRGLSQKSVEAAEHGYESAQKVLRQLGID